MARVLAVIASLALGGCGLAVNPSAMRDMVDALAKDRASACVTAHAMLYGTLTVCRSNAAQARILYSPGQGLVLEHVGAAGE